jgi:hypothetical protein
VTDHRYHEPVRDLPGSLVPSPDGAPWLVPATAEQLAGLVGAHQDPARRLQAKVDGHWCSLEIGADGRVAGATSRAGLPLRVAALWIGRELPAWAGWTLVGEAVGGTPRAADERGHAREYTTPCRIALFCAFAPDGTRHEARDLAGLPDGIAPVPEAGPADDWAAWTLAILRAGGEGVVIRDGAGQCWRAKGRLEDERVVHSTRLHDGHWQLGLALVRRADRRRVLQWVECPAGCEPYSLRRRVVTVRGSALLASGAIRDGVVVRVREDKRVA